MTIDIATVKHIAHLARLRVPAEAEERVANDLNKILAWVEQLNEVKTDGIAPLASVNDEALRLRDDVITVAPQTEAVLQNAPERTADFFTVPKVIE